MDKKLGITDLAKREERLAYTLLIPTFLILLIIAFYPLGSVFYSSLTNCDVLDVNVSAACFTSAS